MPTGKGRVAAVFGWPVEHSLSPRMHGWWLDRYGIDGAYVPLRVHPEDLAEALRMLPKMGFCGVNLTLPHKELAIRYMDTLDARARTIGAVNTVVVDENGALHGRNTDAYGFIENLHRSAVSCHRRKAVVLGAGGAARAVTHGLCEDDFKEIVICNRTLARAEELASRYPGLARAVAWEDRALVLDGAGLLVNTTSLGLAGHEPLDIGLEALPEDAAVTDIVYDPLMTPLLVMAQQKGNRVVDGLGMLMHQGAPAFAAWFGITPEVTPELREFLLA